MFATGEMSMTKFRSPTPAAILAVTLAALPLAANAGTFTPLYSFGAAPAGSPASANPSGLVAANGALYGTTAPFYSNGTVFRFDPTTRALTTLENFSSSAAGVEPAAQTLTVANGLLYGALQLSYVEGAIYSLNLATNIVSRVGYLSYSPGPSRPNGVIYAQGALFGTSAYAGVRAGNNWPGGVFEMNPVTGTLLPLYTFTGGADGGGTHGPLSFAGGALYGATSLGGANGDGVIFKVTTLSGQETVLHSFAGATDGSSPNGVIYDHGTLFGTAAAGGAANAGTVFRIDAATGQAVTLHSFAGGADGSTPAGQLVSDGLYLYGTTTLGGTANMGTIFRVDARTGHEDVLYSFTGGADGATPIGTLLDVNGTFYGTASAGGTNSSGTIFEYVP
jgi:uncharacterized repeat protein (TIGR03803 family)